MITIHQLQSYPYDLEYEFVVGDNRQMATATVGRVSDVSSSESSDEDETSRFREAAVLDCHHSTSASCMYHASIFLF